MKYKILFFLLAFSYVGFAQVDRGFSIEHVLPQRTLALAIFPDIHAVKTAFPDTEMGRLCSSEEFCNFQSHLLTSLKTEFAPYVEYANSLQQETGTSLDDLWQMVDGEFAIALLDMRKERIPFALLGAFEAGEGLPKLLSVLSNEEALTHNFREFTITEAKSMFFTSIENTLLFSTHKYVLEEAIAIYIGEIQCDLLVDSPHFKEARSQTVRGTPIVFFFFNAEEAFSRMRKEMLAEQWEALQPAGLFSFHSVAWAIAIEGKEFREVGWVSAPSPRSGLVKMFDTRPVRIECASDVPGTAVHFACSDLGITAWDVEHLMAVFDAEVHQSWLKRDAESRDRFGASVKDLMQAFTGEGYNFSFITPGGSLLPEDVAVYYLEDEALFRENIMRLIGDCPVAWKNFPYQGKEIFVLPGISSLWFEQGDLTLWSFFARIFLIHFQSFFIEDGRVYVAQSPQILMNYIDQRSGPSLSGDPHFQAAMRGLPPDASSASYYNHGVWLPQVYNTALPLARIAEGFLRASGFPVETAWLPRIRNFREYISPGICFTVADERGITMESTQLGDFNPLGVVIVATTLPLYLAGDRLVVHRMDQRIEEWKKAGFPLTADELRGPAVPDEENAAMDYRQAFAALSLTEDEEYDIKYLYSPFSVGENLDTFRPIVEKNDAAFALLRAGSRHERCRFPLEFEKTISMLREYIWQMTICVHLLNARALVFHYEGTTEEALDTCLTAMRMVGHYREPYLMNMTIWSSTVSKLLDALAIILYEDKGDVSVYSQILREIEAYDPGRHIREAWIAECWVNMHYIDLMLRNELPGRQPLKVDNLLLRPWLLAEKACIMDHYASLISLADQPYYKVRGEIERTDAALQDIPAIFILSRMFLYHLHSYAREKDRITAKIASFKIAMALRNAKAQSGEYPENLRDLSPQILAELPVDPFTGESYIYLREGGEIIVYSVGPDFTDDRGHTWDEKDVGYRLRE